ncbi:hypothetical protein SAMN05892877_117114 [Rhizobium subbaraonis]|uniref:Uncharacterized protein n=1 Tax=Rhizobium subbaraonis TaxID=908946 RepID=A0A285UUY5_9HYPH|nr:hypothetical protein [Rhizobium subbaraonis]SOC45725.1 hypothetical protein SAMN05892877_117114 [Rhizobium subbaraonis]
MAEFIRLNFQDFCDRSGRDTADLRRIASALPDAWLAGGAIRRTLAGMSLDSDFDFFFRSQEHAEIFEANLPGTFRLVKETAHHKHWRGTVEGSDLPIDIQAITFKFYESAEAVIDSFDYTITMFCLDGDDLVTTPYALWDLGRKRLAVHRITYPVATMRRLLKYGKQGFTACSGCMSSILRETANSPEAMAQLDIEYVD